jgi:two-component system invasion response regulator UvrY
MKKILVADDHSLVRNGLKQILSNEFGEIEFGEAANSIEVMREVKKNNWDIIILDINMPGRSGLEILQDIRIENANFRVLILSMHPEEQIAVRTLKLGAWGYLTKDAADKELIDAVKQVMSGRKYITPSLAEQLVTNINNPTGMAPHELLSEREFQTLQLIASGKTVSQIATELSLSVPTVSTYRARILEKMNMKTSAELTNYAVKRGITLL